MLRGFLSLAVAVALTAATVGRADEPPRPPEGLRLVPVASGQAWKAPEGGGLCLDLKAIQYAVEKQRYYETRIKTAESYAEGARWRWLAIGIGAGLAVGATAALVRR